MDGLFDATMEYARLSAELAEIAGMASRAIYEEKHLRVEWGQVCMSFCFIETTGTRNGALLQRQIFESTD